MAKRAACVKKSVRIHSQNAPNANEKPNGGTGEPGAFITRMLRACASHTITFIDKRVQHFLADMVFDIGDAAFIAPNATATGDLSVGRGASIWFGSVVRADRDSISIGENSNIQDNAVVHNSAGFPVIIGKNVSVGHGAILHGCGIGDNVLVGMGSIVLNGARIGSGSIIGAGAVVTEGKEIPPDSLVIGVPGKIARETTENEREEIMKNASVYRELAGKYSGENTK